jgi:hypothetical protein
MDERVALVEALERREGFRYAAELRNRVMAYAKRQRAAGASWSGLADELGVSAQTLARWGEESASGHGEFVSVRTSGAAYGSIVLVSPKGWRLEGLDATTAIQLMRSLSA